LLIFLRIIVKSTEKDSIFQIEQLLNSVFFVNSMCFQFVNLIPNNQLYFININLNENQLPKLLWNHRASRSFQPCNLEGEERKRFPKGSLDVVLFGLMCVLLFYLKTTNQLVFVWAKTKKERKRHLIIHSKSSDSMKKSKEGGFLIFLFLIRTSHNFDSQEDGQTPRLISFSSKTSIL